MPGRSFYSALARFSAVITILPATMAAGWMMGRYLVDRTFNTWPWGTIVCLFLGAASGFYEIFKILMQKNDSPNSSTSSDPSANDHN
jgi:F0F1-type ATP synthase assembly protein I